MFQASCGYPLYHIPDPLWRAVFSSGVSDRHANEGKWDTSLPSWSPGSLKGKQKPQEIKTILFGALQLPCEDSAFASEDESEEKIKFCP